MTMRTLLLLALGTLLTIGGESNATPPPTGTVYRVVQVDTNGVIVAPTNLTLNAEGVSGFIAGLGSLTASGLSAYSGSLLMGLEMRGGMGPTWALGSNWLGRVADPWDPDVASIDDLAANCGWVNGRITAATQGLASVSASLASLAALSNAVRSQMVSESFVTYKEYGFVVSGGTNLSPNVAGNYAGPDGSEVYTHTTNAAWRICPAIPDQRYVRLYTTTTNVDDNPYWEWDESAYQPHSGAVGTITVGVWSVTATNISDGVVIGPVPPSAISGAWSGVQTNVVSGYTQLFWYANGVVTNVTAP